MKLKTFTFLKHKTYLFSFTVLVLGSVLSALPAYSQVDYYYGLNKKGFRLGLGAGVAMLQSNWSSTPPNVAGVASLDYDLSPYFSIGTQAQFGKMTGEDVENKFYYKSTSVFFVGGNVNFKVGVGQFFDYKTASNAADIIKRLYLGIGGGAVYSQSTLVNHPAGEGLSQIGNGATILGAKPTNKGLVGDGVFPYVTASFGTYISLRGFLGSDKVELNPNLQYNYVVSPLFDGYQPNAVDDPASSIKKNGNQSYFIGSLTLRYKF